MNYKNTYSFISILFLVFWVSLIFAKIKTDTFLIETKPINEKQYDYPALSELNRYLRDNESEKALELCNKEYYAAKKLNDKRKMADFSTFSADIHSNLGNDSLAFSKYKEACVIYALFQDTAKISTIFDKLNSTKESTVINKKINDFTIRKKNSDILFLSIIIAILIVLGIAIYLKSYDKIQAAKKLKKEIIEREKTEKLLKASEERFELAMRGANEGLWDWNIATGETYFSPRWKEILGYKPNEINASISEWFSRIHEKDQEKEKTHRASHLEGRSLFYELEYRLRHKTGKYIWVHARGLALNNEKNETIRMVGTIVDVSQRIKYQLELEQNRTNLKELVRKRTFDLEVAKKKLEQSDGLKTAFLQNISHEIRTPMNAIVGFANLLSMTNINENEREEFINKINSNCKVLMKLFDDIIFVSKIQTGEISISKQKIFINPMLDDFFIRYSNLFPNNTKEIDFILEKDINDKNFTIKTDRDLLMQLVTIFLDNAMKFTDKGHIRFGYKHTEKARLTFFFEDTGIGIPEDKKEIIFDRFRKIEGDMSRLYRGAGLGLTIGKTIVELLNGDIWLESEVEQGTTFFFEIPIS